MATAYHNLSDYDFNSVPSAENMKFGIVVSEWNYNITGALLKGAIDTLKKHGAKDENIINNRYECQLQLIEIDNLKKELIDIKYDALTRSSELMERSRQSRIEEYIATKESDLQTSTNPPYLLK